MTREENLHWLNQEILTWENECQSKHPVKEALYAARKALKQEPTLEKDGTLIVTTEHYKNVGRVLVQCGTNGALFYQDQDPTTKNDIRDNRVKNELNRVKDELEPTTKNDLEVDAISRQAVIDELKRYFHDEYYQRTSIQDCRDCFIEDVLNHLPSVTPQEPRKGHWIEKWDSEHLVILAYECSECGTMRNVNTSHYCPYCGADMREGEE